MPSTDKLLANGAEEVGLSAARIAEGQHVLVTVHERTLEQGIELQVHLSGEPLAIEPLPALFQRKPRLSEKASHAILLSGFHLELDHFVEILLIA